MGLQSQHNEPEQQQGIAASTLNLPRSQLPCLCLTTYSREALCRSDEALQTRQGRPWASSSSGNSRSLPLLCWLSSVRGRVAEVGNDGAGTSERGPFPVPRGQILGMYNTGTRCTPLFLAVRLSFVRSQCCWISLRVHAVYWPSLSRGSPSLSVMPFFAPPHRLRICVVRSLSSPPTHSAGWELPRKICFSLCCLRRDESRSGWEDKTPGN